MATSRGTSTRTTLSIKSETVQRIYDNHTKNAYIVNRRYQRKLVWSIEEKRSFIDSLRNGFPVPLILLGETTFEDAHCFEVIDGLQRLNAITSFIEGEFDLDEAYFDLKSIPETNLRLNDGTLEQKQPLLGQVECARIASYEVATSIIDSKQKQRSTRCFVASMPTDVTYHARSCDKLARLDCFLS